MEVVDPFPEEPVTPITYLGYFILDKILLSSFLTILAGKTDACFLNILQMIVIILFSSIKKLIFKLITYIYYITIYLIFKKTSNIVIFIV